MNARRNSATLGENLVKQELITRDELNKAKEKEASTGTPWYKQLIQARKVSFNAVEDMLRYEFHSKAVHTVQQSMGDTLVGMGVLTQDKLEEALSLQKRKGRLLGLQKFHGTAGMGGGGEDQLLVVLQGF